MFGLYFLWKDWWLYHYGICFLTYHLQFKHTIDNLSYLNTFIESPSSYAPNHQGVQLCTLSYLVEAEKICLRNSYRLGDQREPVLFGKVLRQVNCIWKKGVWTCIFWFLKVCSVNGNSSKYALKVCIFCWGIVVREIKKVLKSWTWDGGLQIWDVIGKTSWYEKSCAW